VAAAAFTSDDIPGPFLTARKFHGKSRKFSRGSHISLQRSPDHLLSRQPSPTEKPKHWLESAEAT